MIEFLMDLGLWCGGFSGGMLIGSVVAGPKPCILLVVVASIILPGFIILARRKIAGVKSKGA